MQKEMAAMRKAIEGSADIPAEKRQMMEGHMGRMQQQMQGMQDQCRRMGGMMGMGEMEGSGGKQGMGAPSRE
jgi:hypothetical protein